MGDLHVRSCESRTFQFSMRDTVPSVFTTSGPSLSSWTEPPPTVTTVVGPDSCRVSVYEHRVIRRVHSPQASTCVSSVSSFVGAGNLGTSSSVMHSEHTAGSVRHSSADQIRKRISTSRALLEPQRLRFVVSFFLAPFYQRGFAGRKIG